MYRFTALKCEIHTIGLKSLYMIVLFVKHLQVKSFFIGFYILNRPYIPISRPHTKERWFSTKPHVIFRRNLDQLAP
jgi:hypothetical protein